MLNATYGATPGIGIHRASLFVALYKAAVQAGCVLHNSSTVIETYTSDTGRYLRLEDAQTVGPYDLVIDATGAGSTLSELTRKPLTFGALWGTVDWPAGTRLPYDNLTQKYRKSAKMIGVLPIGRMPEVAGNKAAIFWSLPVNEFGKWRATPLNSWKKEAGDLWPEFTPFLDQITSHGDMTMARYSHGTMAKPYGDRLVHIGDAAHSASPQLGQGANMALLDALALALALGRFPLDRALPHYAASRRRHIQLYQTFSQIFTPAYQSKSWLVPLIRDWLLAPLSFVPPVPWILQRLVSGDFVLPIKGSRLNDLGGMYHDGQVDS